jgi:hypothetical protein
MSFWKDKYLALTIGEVEVDLSRSTDDSVPPNTSNLMGVVRASDGNTFKLDQAFAESLFSKPADKIAVGNIFPEGLTIDIKNALVAETGTTAAKTKIIAANFGANIDLSNIPIAGKMLPSGENLSIENFQVLFSTKPIDGVGAKALNGIVPDGIASLPATILKDVNISATLNMGDNTITIGTSSMSQIDGGSTDKGLATKTTHASQGNVDKTFGPVHIQSVFLGFKDGDLTITIDASIKFGPLVLGFDQLEIGSPINKFEPEIGLKGLSLDYSKNDFAIEGAFLNQGGGEYSGMFSLSLTKLQLTAIGSYKDDNGSPSLFVYGLLDEPLGGPAFCFVEGVAVAFGYNRNFIAPPVTDISTFPLISAAANGTPAQSTNGLATMMTTLDEYIPPKMGEYFVGLGIKFMSFKVINSFALLIVKFGDELEFDLLGESTYVAPNPKDPKPIATVELEIIGSYKPALGTLLIRGQLTPNSFVLSKKCHLEGGFAIANWFKGNYEGDFVYTFGGYSKHYKPPSHYPQNIPKLGFLWQIDPEVSIKGGGYWAITPKELMVGGYLKAAYSTSSIRASFDIDAYFLIDWSPLHYTAGFTVTFSLSVYIDILFVSGWIGFELSEGLEIHGPPFGGTAYIDLAVCTVHVNFGEGPTTQPLLTGQKFREAFLPKPSASAPVSQILSINIVDGLVKKEKDVYGNELYVINPKDLKITTESFVPITGFSPDVKELNDKNILVQAQGDKFEITPMGVDFDGITNNSTHTVTITKEGETTDSAQFSTVKAATKDAPKSIWEQYTGDGKTKTIVTDSYESKLSPLVFGTDIKPGAPIPVSSTSSVDRSVLANETFLGKEFKWETVNPFGGTLTKVSAITDTSIDSLLLLSLDNVFEFGSQVPPDNKGLQKRLTKIKGQKINSGTLKSAS